MKTRKVKNDQRSRHDLFHGTDFFVQKIHPCKKQHCTATVKIHISLFAGFHKRQGILHQRSQLLPDISVNTGKPCSSFLCCCSPGYSHNARNQSNSRKTCTGNGRPGKFQQRMQYFLRPLVRFYDSQICQIIESRKGT